MKKQADGNDADWSKEKANTISNNSRVRVEWMKPNATSIGIKNRICQQVVKINKHGR